MPPPPAPTSEPPLCVLGVANGRSIHTLRWARRLVDRGHEVHIVTDDLRAGPGEAEGVVIHDVRRLDLITRIPRVRRLRFGAAIRSLARRVGADVVHGHGITPYAYWAALADVHPLVVSPWGRDVLVDAKKEPGRSRALRTWRSADYLVVNSGAIERAAVEAGADPSRVAHIIWHTQLSGFGPENADPAGLRDELGWPADSLIVLSLRNFQARTNLDVLVRAFAGVHHLHPEARLLLAARGGETRADVEGVAKATGLGDAIRFHSVPPDRLPWLAASGDVVVSIASTDSSPSSLLEAMASGNAIVGGWCPSIDEWIGPGDGAEMVGPRDEDALCAALDRLLSDPELRRRYAERNLRVVRERVAESAPALEALYRRLIREHAESVQRPVGP